MSSFNPSSFNFNPQINWQALGEGRETPAPFGSMTVVDDKEHMQVEETPVSRKRDVGELQGLDFLAEEADRAFKRQRVEELEKFWGIVKALGDSDDPIFNEIAELCDIDFQNLEKEYDKVEKLFDSKELEKLVPLLRWYYLLKMGDLPGVGLKGIKSMLGVNYFVEMLFQRKSDGSVTSDQWSVEYLSKLLDYYQKNRESFNVQSKTCYLSITGEVFETILKVLDTENLFNLIESYFEFEDSEFLNRYIYYFDEMDTFTKLQWVMFASVASFQLTDTKEGLTAKPGVWPSSIPKEVLPIVKKIDYRLAAMNGATTKSSGSSSPTFGAGSKKFNFMSFMTPKITAGVGIPGMPNWMPNGGDSCYVSSTLWSLFLTANHDLQRKMAEFEQEELAEQEAAKETEVQEKIEFSSKSVKSQKKRKVALLIEKPPENDRQAELVKEAKREFCQFYKNLAAQEKKEITTAQVNNLRRAIQRAFPEHYIVPRAFSQEDAYEFLVCVMQSLWNLDSCSPETPKFKMYHKFGKVGEEPFEDVEHYKYDEALNDSSNAEPTPIVNVRLNDGKKQSLSFRDLVTRERHTGEIERQVSRKEEWKEGPKYRYIKSEHSEQLVVDSKENSPEYFIGHLSRFHQDMGTGLRSKRFDVVVPNATLEFNTIADDGGTVAYDLTAITVHSGRTINGGHYYTYIRKKVEGSWKFFKYDDIAGTQECVDEESVIGDVAKNGYIFYYKKRGEHDVAPTPLPYENDIPKDLGVSRKRKQRDISSSKASTSTKSSESPKSPKSPVGGSDSKFNFLTLPKLDFGESSGGNSPALGSVDLKAFEGLDWPNLLGSGSGGSWMSLDTTVPPLTEPATMPKESTGEPLKNPVKRARKSNTESTEWVLTKLSRQFSLSSDANSYNSLPNLFGNEFKEQFSAYIQDLSMLADESEVLNTVCNLLGRTIYLIDPTRDRDLQVVAGYPIPGDKFRYGEDFSNGPTLYLFRDSEQNYVIVNFQFE